MLKRNSALELGLFVLAAACLLASGLELENTPWAGLSKQLLLSACYGISGLLLISKTIRFKHLVSRLALSVWCLATGLVLMSSLATALLPDLEFYTIWLTGILVFLNAGQHILLHDHS